MVWSELQRLWGSHTLGLVGETAKRSGGLEKLAPPAEGFQVGVAMRRADADWLAKRGTMAGDRGPAGFLLHKGV